MKSQATRRLSRMGVMAALSVVLVLVVHFPLIPAAPYLEYDPANVPILIVTFLYGPWQGVLMTAVVSLLQGLTVSSGSGWVGIVMHFVSTSCLCLTAGFLYRKHKSRGRAVLALTVGSLVMAAAMCGMNLLLTPLYTGLPRAEVAAMLLPIILPFNLLKAGINSVITMLIYKSAGRLLRR